MICTLMCICVPSCTFVCLPPPSWPLCQLHAEWTKCEVQWYFNQLYCFCDISLMCVVIVILSFYSIHLVRNVGLHQTGREANGCLFQLKLTTHTRLHVCLQERSLMCPLAMNLLKQVAQTLQLIGFSLQSQKHALKLIKVCLVYYFVIGFCVFESVIADRAVSEV